MQEDLASYWLYYLLQVCTTKKILLPIGSPPFVCLLACRQPRVTQR